MALTDLKTNATEKIDEGMHTVKKVMRQRAHELEDLRDATALKIRRAPFQTMAIAAGSGLMLGWAMGFAKGRARAMRRTNLQNVQKM